MSVIKAIILGIVQGLTEFLPVSSSGHLVLLQKIFNIEEGALTFDIALHFATLIAVLVIYRQRILEMIKSHFLNYLYILLLPPFLLQFLVFC